MQLGLQAGIQLLSVFPVALWPRIGPEAATRDKNPLCFTLENWKTDTGQLFPLSLTRTSDEFGTSFIFYMLLTSD